MSERRTSRLGEHNATVIRSCGHSPLTRRKLVRKVAVPCDLFIPQWVPSVSPEERSIFSLMGHPQSWRRSLTSGRRVALSSIFASPEYAVSVHSEWGTGISGSTICFPVARLAQNRECLLRSPTRGQPAQAIRYQHIRGTLNRRSSLGNSPLYLQYRSKPQHPSHSFPGEPGVTFPFRRER